MIFERRMGQRKSVTFKVALVVGARKDKDKRQRQYCKSVTLSDAMHS
jgi:hypothetical protein